MRTPCFIAVLFYLVFSPLVTLFCLSCTFFPLSTSQCHVMSCDYGPYLACMVLMSLQTAEGNSRLLGEKNHPWVLTALDSFSQSPWPPSLHVHFNSNANYSHADVCLSRICDREPERCLNTTFYFVQITVKYQDQHNSLNSFDTPPKGIQFALLYTGGGRDATIQACN